MTKTNNYIASRAFLFGFRSVASHSIPKKTIHTFHIIPMRNIIRFAERTSGFCYYRETLYNTSCNRENANSKLPDDGSKSRDIFASGPREQFICSFFWDKVFDLTSTAFRVQDSAGINFHIIEAETGEMTGAQTEIIPPVTARDIL